MSFVYLALFSPQWFRLMSKKHQEMISTPVKFIMSEPPTTILICNAPDDMMDVTGVRLNPDPPKKGGNVTVSIDGILKHDVLPGAYLVARVKKGGIRLPQFHVTACEYLTTGCPVSKGATTISMMFDIPKLLPGGGYDIEAVLYNKEQDALGKHQLKNMKKWMGPDKSDSFQIEGKRVACIQGSLQL